MRTGSASILGLKGQLTLQGEPYPGSIRARGSSVLEVFGVCTKLHNGFVSALIVSYEQNQRNLTHIKY